MNLASACGWDGWIALTLVMRDIVCHWGVMRLKVI
jgi:hypothetical protein